MKKLSWFTIVKDVVSLTLGVFIVIYQQLTGNVSLPLLAIASGLIGVPGVVNLLWVVRQNTDTLGQSSPPQQYSSATPSDKP